jgi:L-ascorbate metabolism protein UlaG (beta-lactamase superfamily)
MRCRWLGWAGVELEHDGARIVIDPLEDPAGLYAPLGDAAAGVTLPEIVPPSGRAIAGLVTHLHRDHTDAGALAGTLADGAPLLAPQRPSEDPGVRQTVRELASEALELRQVSPWETVEIGPFRITALPAADGLGDPQVSWAVEAGGKRVVHCGDTLFHGWWWRAAHEVGPFDAAFLPVNGAAVNFPWLQPPSPLPAAMTPEEAAVAARALGARRAVPIHFGAFDLEPFYRSIPDALERFTAATPELAAPLAVGAALEL